MMAKKIVYESSNVKIELFDSVEEMKKPVNYGTPTEEEYEARTNTVRALYEIERKTRAKED